MSNKGWECPKCGKVYAPWNPECDHCNHKTRETKIVPVAPHEPMTTPGCGDWYYRFPPIITCGRGTASTRDDIKYEVYS